MQTLREILRPAIKGLRRCLGTAQLSPQLHRLEERLGRIEASNLETSALARSQDLLAGGLSGPDHKPDMVSLSLPDGQAYFLSVASERLDVYRDALRANGAQDATWRLLMAWVRAGDVFFDLGANVGAIAIPAAVSGAEVHAFEMLPENFARLVEGVERNGFQTVSVVLGAVWNSASGVGLAGFSAWGSVGGSGKVSIATVAIDDYVAARGVSRVDVMKIDVEGSEANALDGAKKLIARDCPDLVVESNSITCGNSGYSYRDLLAVLTASGYRVFRIDDGWLSPVKDDIPQEIICVDYLATIKSDEEITRRCGWPVRPMSSSDLKTNVAAQAFHGVLHREHVLAVWDELPDEVRADDETAGLVKAWHLLDANSQYTAAFKVGTAVAGRGAQKIRPAD